MGALVLLTGWFFIWLRMANEATATGSGKQPGMEVITDVVSVTPASVGNDAAARELYQEMDLAQMGLSKKAFELALTGHKVLRASGALKKRHLLTIADFSQPSTAKRLLVLDLHTRQVLLQTWVAHGRNSGGNRAETFSNLPGSLQSSLGFYLTAETYTGKYGTSMRLDGLEKGINDKARERAIVMHPAEYVSEQMIRSQGRLGRSFGCPAVSYGVHEELIGLIAGKSCLFIFHPDSVYAAQSTVLMQASLL